MAAWVLTAKLFHLFCKFDDFSIKMLKNIKSFTHESVSLPNTYELLCYILGSELYAQVLSDSLVKLRKFSECPTSNC